MDKAGAPHGIVQGCAVRVAEHCNRLPSQAEQAPSLEMLRDHPDTAQGS